MKRILTVLTVLTLSGCATIDRIIDALPDLPERPDTGQPSPEQPKPEPPQDSQFPPPGVSQDQSFLWKPEAHVGGRGVAVLLPARERGHVEQIEIVQGGKVIQRINRHRTNETWVNGARPHFYTGRAATDYNGPLIIHGLRVDGGRPEWGVPDPLKRTTAR